MKGIFNIKIFNKNIPKNPMNFLRKGMKIPKDSCLDKSENNNKIGIEHDSENKNIFKEIYYKNFTQLKLISDKFKLSLSNLFINYYYKLQVSNLSNNITDSAVMNFSEDKNNLNGQNKNLNEDEINYKLTGNSKEHKNSNGILIEKLNLKTHQINKSVCSFI